MEKKPNEVVTWWSSNRAALWVLALGFGAAVVAWATGWLKIG